jgi:transcriptional regulator of arginine metabolism
MLNDDIIDLIERGVADQSTLLTELRKLGHEITQSSISRKLKQLGVIKLHGKYQVTLKGFNKEVRIIFTPPNLIVIRTVPGHANAMAAIIDNKLIANSNYSEFVGSIAGDDTIFLAVDLNGRDSQWAIEQVKRVIL